MDLGHLLDQIVDTRRCLFAEGYLNENFTYLEDIEEEYNVGFSVHDAMKTYFADSASVLTQVEQELGRVPLDFGMLGTLLSQISRSTITVGGNNVLIKVNQLRDMVDRRYNTQSCKNVFSELKVEFERFKSKIELYLEMNEWNLPDEINDNYGCDDETSDENS